MDPVNALPCRRCGALNPPGARFCHQCGATEPAVSATPATGPAANPAPTPATAHAFPLAAQVPRKAGRGRLWTLLGGLFLIALIALAAVAIAVAPRPQPPRPCEPRCPRPPVTGLATTGVLKQATAAPPLALQHRYVSSAYHYALEYNDQPSGAQLAGQNDHAIGWQVRGYPYQFSGQPANGQAAPDIVNQVQNDNFPDAQPVYAIPGAEIGYVPGAGTVYDLMAQSGSGQSVHARLIIIAAVQNDLAIDLIAIGPYVQSTQKDGHPNPADTPLVDLFDPIVNTITWPGQPPL